MRNERGAVTLVAALIPLYVGAVFALVHALFGQTTDPSGDLLSLRNIAAYYGVAAPLVAYLLWDKRADKTRIADLEKRNAELVDASFDKIVPLATEMTGLVRDVGAAAVRRARTLDDDDVARIADAVKARG